MTTCLAAGKTIPIASNIQSPAQLVLEPVQGGGVARNCAWLQVTDAEDFSRLLRVNETAKRNELGEKGKDGDLSLDAFPCSLTRHLPLFSFDHLVRSEQHGLRDRQADLLGCL